MAMVGVEQGLPLIGKVHYGAALIDDKMSLEPDVHRY
jgi:hypothetical protein